MELLEKISPFLMHDARFDEKCLVLEHVLGLTGTTEGKDLLLSSPDILVQLITLMQCNPASIAKHAALCLINLTAEEAGTSAMLIISESLTVKNDTKYSHNLVEVCMRCVMDKSSALADCCCMILSNMTRPQHFVDRMIALIEKSGFPWDSLVTAFTQNEYNCTGAKLHYLGPMFCNLSQSLSIRKYLMDKERCVIQRLLPFTEYADSIVRRGGIVGTLKNCCFDVENHEWLLGPEVDILSYLLLPLAGPEELDDEEQDKLPISLQYLPETKNREPDPDIRLIILEALGQLCATKRGREIMREKNVYVILREFHKWEKNKSALLACENTVDILIKTEEEIGLDNLKDVEVPEEYHEKFHQMDKDFISDA